MAEAHCSYFFNRFQAHLFLFCSCSYDEQPGDPIELENNVNDCSSNAPLLGKKSGVYTRMVGLKVKSCITIKKLEEYHISFNDGTSD